MKPTPTSSASPPWVSATRVSSVFSSPTGRRLISYADRLRLSAIGAPPYPYIW
jgi:hypothetical protein